MAQTETRQIDLCGETVTYQFTRKNVKNINMRVHVERGLSVSAPLRVPMAQVEEALQRNGARIVQKLHENAARQTAMGMQYPVSYRTGEPVLYLGAQYTLQTDTSSRNTVVVDKKAATLLLLTRPDSTATCRKRVFDTWWHATCAQTVGHLCRSVYPVFEAKGVPYPTEIRYRQMTSQWGNCRPETGILTFNLRLLAAPPRCIEYVVFHEFTHFLYPDHSRAFYQFVESEIPDWKDLQNTLEQTVRMELPPSAV